MIVGPPATGKTDVAVQIIANLYRTFPGQRIVVITHSNQALNQIFEKLIHLNIDEQHLLRLGHGEEEIESTKDFSRRGRVNYILERRLKDLAIVGALAKSLGAQNADYSASTCEAALYFWTVQVVPRWKRFLEKAETRSSDFV
jgi:intron-binding protein aquarius